MLRVLVCGGRGYRESATLICKLDSLQENEGKFSCIIHGGALGADLMAGLYALGHGVEERVFPANWHKYGKSAGPIRNAQMLREGKPDLVVAFPGGKGTLNMVEQARDAGVKVIIV